MRQSRSNEAMIIHFWVVSQMIRVQFVVLVLALVLVFIFYGESVDLDYRGGGSEVYRTASNNDSIPNEVLRGFNGEMCRRIRRYRSQITKQ